MTKIHEPAVAPAPEQPPGHECCMCGDSGLTVELFRCKLCLFRSQHRYCSNVYPKAEAYTVCNWCLLLDNKGDSSSGQPSCDEDGGDLKLQKRSAEGSPSPPGRKRMISMEEMSKSNGNGIKKQVFRNKVRRYKLLDEVST